MTTPTDSLRQVVARDPARPRLTWYDEASGERIELSGASLINWVNKTSHLLVDELDVQPGAVVAIDLPRHWITAVWWWACDAVGASPRLGEDPDAAVSVVGPDSLDRLPATDEVVAVSLLPLGAPFADPLPALVRDYAVDVRGQGDQFSPTVPGDAAVGGQAQLLADQWGLRSTDRVLAAGPLSGRNDLVASLLAPIAADASVVWVRNQPPANFVQTLATERVTVGVANQPAASLAPMGIRWLPPPAVSC